MAETNYDFTPYIDQFHDIYRDQYKMDGDNYKPIQYTYTIDGQEKSVNQFTDTGHYSQEFLDAQEEQGIEFMSSYTGITPRQAYFDDRRRNELEKLIPEEMSMTDKAEFNMAIAQFFDRPFYNKESGELESPAGLFNYYMNEKQKLGAFVPSDVDPFAHDISGSMRLDKVMKAYIDKTYSTTPPAETKIIDDMKSQEGGAY